MRPKVRSLRAAPRSYALRTGAVILPGGQSQDTAERRAMSKALEATYSVECVCNVSSPFDLTLRW